MNRKFIVLLTLILITITGYAQTYTISGYISDKTNGEILIGAAVFDQKSKDGSITNAYGYYSITLPKGIISLRYSYVGYDMEIKEFELKSDTLINLGLASINSLGEVIISAKKNELGVKGSQMSAVDIPMAQLNTIPSLLGEKDLIKILQLLPGVQSGTEGSAGLYVRGGGADENLLLLDGVPVYNVNHLFGFFSVFNTDAIKNVTLYKGSFPARFGGRLSSVVDIRTKDGDDKNYHGSFSIGLLSSKFNFEGPIVKERTTFNISARRTYMDVLAKPFLMGGYEDGETNTGGYYFYDINSKITHKFSNNDKIYLSTYFGKDVVFSKNDRNSSDIVSSDGNSRTKHLEKTDWYWGTIILALRWNHVVNNKLFMNTTLDYTNYKSDLKSFNSSERTENDKDIYDKNTINYNSGIRDLSLKFDFDYMPNVHNSIKFGLHSTYHIFSPDVFGMSRRTNNKWEKQVVDTLIGSGKIKAMEIMGYVEDNVKLSDKFSMNMGLHISIFNVHKKNYASLQPRLSMNYLINDNISVKMGYAYMKQYIHLLSNNMISMPTDLWVPATGKISPMKSHQYSIGLFYNLNDIIDLSLEGYYKSMDNLIEYKEGASFLAQSANWENKVSMGRGWAYGLEFLAQRSFGNTTGWIGYTWAKSERLFDRKGEELNYGKVFPAKYDRRHDVSITLNHKFSESIDISCTWVYASGNAATLALQNYSAIIDKAMVAGGIRENSLEDYIESRNNYRLPSYQRLDIGINFHKKKKYGIRTWNLSVYNVYNRLNPFYIYKDYKEVRKGGSKYSKPILKKFTLFPLIPSISYTYKF